MIRSCIATIALLCVLPGLAAADDDFARPGWYLGLNGIYAFHWFPGNYDQDVTGGTAVKTENSAGLNVRGGYRFNTWAAAELEYEWVSAFENKVAGSRIFDHTYHTVTANGKFLYPGWGRWQPYGLVGIGFSAFDISNRSGFGAALDSSAFGFALRAGAGMDIYLTPSWLFNVGLEVVYPTDSIGNANPIGHDVSNLLYVPVQFGMQYRF